MRDQAPENSTQGENLRPAWLKKDFDGMVQVVPPAAPGKAFFRPRLAGSHPGRLEKLLIQPGPWRLSGLMVVIFLVAGFFYLSPRLTQSAFQVSGLIDYVEDPTQVPPIDKLDSASAFYTRNLTLDTMLLNRWSDKKWNLFYTSSSLGLSLPNSKVYSTLLALKPRGFSSQDFVQDTDPCLPPTCQVSWAGIVFDNAALALQAFNALDNDLKSSTIGYNSLGFNDLGYRPGRSCVSKIYADSGWVSCLFQWNNLVTSMRTYTQTPDDHSFVNTSIQLIEQVNNAWVIQWNRKLNLSPIP